MDFYPNFTQLGKLELIEVYEFYDKPLLVSCRNHMGQIYIALLVDENSDFEVWYYVQVSQNRFDAIRSGLIDLRNIFVHSESGDVIEVSIPFDDTRSIQLKYLLAKQLSNEYLPVPNEFITKKFYSPEQLVEAFA